MVGLLVPTPLCEIIDRFLRSEIPPGHRPERCHFESCKAADRSPIRVLPSLKAMLLFEA